MPKKTDGQRAPEYQDQTVGSVVRTVKLEHLCEESEQGSNRRGSLGELRLEPRVEVSRRTTVSAYRKLGEPGEPGSGSGPEADRYPYVQMLRMPDLVLRTTLCGAHLYKLRKEGKFPQPAELGRGVRAWPEFLLDAWLSSRMEARSAMVNLTDPVELPLWTPELEREALDNARAGIQMVRRPVVLLRVSVRKTKLYDLIETAGFPWPVPIGVCARAWVGAEVDEWLRARYECRRAQDPGFAFLTGPRPGSSLSRRSGDS